METAPEPTLVLDARRDAPILRALASEVRLRILELLGKGPLNVNAIAEDLDLPQSTVAVNVQTLEEAGLVATEAVKARKGTQKLCRARYTEVLLRFGEPLPLDDAIQVAMPVGLFTNFEVKPPCGLCSPTGTIGYLDVPASFFSPDRAKAGLLWFGSGWVEYKFPNNARLDPRPITRLELIAELSSETPGTNPYWKSDISLAINDVEVGTWTSPGDYGDRRGTHTPAWWKLEGSQYGLSTVWSVTPEGSFVNGTQVSDLTLAALELGAHHSVKVRLGVKDEAAHRGGMNLFGHGFGDFGRDLTLKLGF